MHDPLPRHLHWPARIRFISGGLVYLLAIGVALLNAVASFVLIAVVAVYYIVQRTPPTDGTARRAPADTTLSLPSSGPPTLACTAE
jgi:hypothetical protein